MNKKLNQKGFMYLESVFTLFLLLLLLGVVNQTIETIDQKRMDSQDNTASYLLARSLIEQWKAKGSLVDAEDHFIHGKCYAVRARLMVVSEMVEKCEVEVSWQSSGSEEKKVTMEGYRFAPVNPPPSTGAASVE
nr:hypothetical protein [Aneurinibacillus terranovensis]